MIDMIQPAGCPALYQPRGLAEVSGDERASDAEQNRDDKTTRIFPRHQKFRDCANDKTDKNSRKNSHSEPRCIGLIRAQQGN